MFVQFQSNSDFMPFPPHNFSQSREKFFFRSTRCVAGDGEEVLLHIYTHFMSINAREHMWHNKARNEQKINFIFRFPSGKKDFRVCERGGKKDGKIIAISSVEAASDIARDLSARLSLSAF